MHRRRERQKERRERQKEDGASDAFEQEASGWVATSCSSRACCSASDRWPTKLSPEAWLVGGIPGRTAPGSTPEGRAPGSGRAPGRGIGGASPLDTLMLCSGEGWRCLCCIKSSMALSRRRRGRAQNA